MNRTAVAAAAAAGRCHRLLLDANPDASTVDERMATPPDGRTAMSAACRMGHLDCVKVLSAWSASREWGPEWGREWGRHAPGK